MLTLNAAVPSCLADNVSLQQLQPVESQTGASVSFIHDIGGVNMRQLNVSGNNALAALGAVLQLCTEVAPSQAEEHVLHLYVSPQHVGSIIGKAGCQISEIRALHPQVRFNMEKHPRAVAQEEGMVMPMQTEGPKERTMTISGTISDASNGLLAVARVIQDVYLGYHTAPQPAFQAVPRAQKRMRIDGGFATTPFHTGPQHMTSNRPQGLYAQPHHPQQHFHRPRPQELVLDPVTGQYEGEFSIAIPSDVAGLLIGRGGATITQIRSSTGCKVEIDKHPQNNTAVRNLRARGGLLELEQCIRAVRERLEAGADGGEQ